MCKDIGSSVGWDLVPLTSTDCVIGISRHMHVSRSQKAPLCLPPDAGQSVPWFRQCEASALRDGFQPFRFGDGFTMAMPQLRIGSAVYADVRLRVYQQLSRNRAYTIVREGEVMLLGHNFVIYTLHGRSKLVVWLRRSQGYSILKSATRRITRRYLFC